MQIDTDNQDRKREEWNTKFLFIKLRQLGKLRFSYPSHRIEEDLSELKSLPCHDIVRGKPAQCYHPPPCPILDLPAPQVDSAQACKDLFPQMCHFNPRQW
jgi:hypothetical protein